MHQDRPHHGVGLIDLRRCCPNSEANCKMYRATKPSAGPCVGLPGVDFLRTKTVMERVFIGATRAEATRMADEWWELKRDFAKLCVPKWLLAERDRTLPSLINGP